MSVQVLAEVSVSGVEQFLEVFATEGLDKRAEHGCLGTSVFTPLGAEGSRVLVMLTFPDLDTFEAFRTDPSAPPIMSKGGAQGPPTFTVLEQVGTFDH